MRMNDDGLRRPPPRILHVSPSDKFLPELIRLIQSEFPDQCHVYRVLGPPQVAHKWPVDRRLRFLSPAHLAHLFGLLREMYRCDRIMLHGLYFTAVNVLLLANPWLLAKTHWIVWGSDLYAWRRRRENGQRRAKELLRGPVIRHLSSIVVSIRGEFALAYRWYRTRARFQAIWTYPSVVFRDPGVPMRGDVSAVNVMIGNSADPSNQHAEMLRLLLPYRDHQVRIFAPLSYGDAENAQRVADMGRQMFGDKFIPMRDFMSLRQYVVWLGSIDIAMFAHRRQQAMGNTVQLLGLGKKVYMHSCTSSCRHLRQIGATVYDIEDFTLDSRHDARLATMAAIRRHYSPDALIGNLERLFGCRALRTGGGA